MLCASVHRPHVIGQHEDECAGAGCGGAGEDAAAEDFYRSVVREGDAVFGGAESVGEDFKFLVAAGELYRFHGGSRAFATAQENEEIGAAGFFCDFAQVDGAELLQVFFVFRDRGVYLGVAAGERGQAAAGFGVRTQRAQGKRVGAQGKIFVAALFVDLPEMVADFAVVAESPGGGDVFFGFVQIAFAEIDPAQRVPVGDERWTPEASSCGVSRSSDTLRSAAVVAETADSAYCWARSR